MIGHNMAFISAKLSCYLQKIRGCAKKHHFPHVKVFHVSLNLTVKYLFQMTSLFTWA